MIIKFNNACLDRLFCMGVRELLLTPSGHSVKLQQFNQVYVSAKGKCQTQLPVVMTAKIKQLSTEYSNTRTTLKATPH